MKPNKISGPLALSSLAIFGLICCISVICE